MRVRGMMVALSLLAAACGDDAGPSDAPTDGSLDGAILPSPDGGPDSQVLSDARAPDGGLLDAMRDDGGDPTNLGDGSSSLGPLAAGFTVETSTGAAPLFERALSTATGTVETLYDWGEGAGFEARATHRYKTAGSFTVQQQVKSASGAIMTAMASVTVTSFTPVRFSTTDKTMYLTVSPDGYEVEQAGLEQSGGRSDGSIAPGSGVFYFEVRRLAERFYRGAVGIASSASLLEYRFDPAAGPNTESVVALLGTGDMQSAGGSCTPATGLDITKPDIGYVVDYRGATPVVKLVQDVAGVPTVRGTCTSPITTPVFVYFAGERAIVGRELRINTGADTVNAPFVFAADKVRAALTASGDATAASALVMGFGKTNAGRLDSPPTLTVPADSSVALGTPVTLTGSALDVEDGNLDAQINWVDTSLQHHLWKPTLGASFTFTPSKLGIHPIVVTVQDLDGVKVTKTVNVTVTGTLPMPNPVELVPTAETTAAMIDVSPDKLSAGFRTNAKDGIRANQGIYGAFWYFEVHRNNPTRNMGMGVVIEDGLLVPYEFYEVPWSASINVLGTGSVYSNLILQPGGDWQVEGNDYTDYGFAVDYRGLHPILHLIIGDKVQTTVKLNDIWAPIYPMLYGNGSPPSGSPYDYTVRFTPASIVQHPREALTTAGIDTNGFKVGWGVHAQ